MIRRPFLATPLSPISIYDPSNVTTDDYGLYQISCFII